MNTLEAFGRGQANLGKERMVFDWDEAARRIVASGARRASAGLSGDWEWTGGTIFKDGAPDTEDYTYLASTWATPEIDLGNGPEPCFRMESQTPGWHSRTKWPESALAVLAAGV